MKKYLSYILILIVLIGLFSPIAQVKAQVGSCVDASGKPIPNTFENCKPPNKWSITITPKPYATPNYEDPNEIGTCSFPLGMPSIQTTKTQCSGSWRSNKYTPPKVYATPPATINLPYQLLAPLPNPKTGTTFGIFDPLTLTAFSDYLNLMIKIFIGICAVLAVVMIVIGGLEYMTSELVSSKEAGKEKIQEALLGLLIALGAFALLNTINPALLNSEFKMDEAVVQVDVGTDVPQTYDPVTKKYKNGATYGNKWDDSVGGIQSLPSGVSVSPTGDCATVGQPKCTSLRGLNLNYINKIQAYCSACQTLVITGGTESWLHGGTTGNTSHGLNSPTVDLRIDTNLTNYIKSGTSQGNNRYLKDGVSYLYEGDHWHAGP